MEKKKIVLLTTVVVAVLLVSVVGITYAYYIASVGGTGNTTNNQTSVTAVDLGSIYYDGITTFTGTNLYPGQKFVQEFKIGPNSESGIGTYIINLESDIPGGFLEDVMIKLYKTTDKVNNNIVRVEGEIVQESGFEDGYHYYQNDAINVLGNPELVYGPEALYKNTVNLLEEVPFDVTTLEETTYYLVYEYKNNGLQDHQQGLSFNAKVTVSLAKASPPSQETSPCITKYGEDAVQCDIVASVNTEGLCPTVNGDETIVKPSAETYNAVVCEAPDDYGTSYYFRGVPENNWVKFGGHYWRIIRINGDDTVRMIYAGDASVIDSLDAATKANVMSNGYNDKTTKYTQIGTSAYNEYWKKDNVIEPTNSLISYDNAGVGYMYGNRDREVQSETDDSISVFEADEYFYISPNYNYDEATDRYSLVDPVQVKGSEFSSSLVDHYTFGSTNASYTDSSIKKIITAHYYEGLYNVYFHSIAHGTSSKEIAQTNTNDSDAKTILDAWYATNLASYSSYISDTIFCNDRQIQDNYIKYGFGPEGTVYRAGVGGAITLKCASQNDRFTVADEVLGNKKLSYPIGLINIDEAMIAGGTATNKKYYLYTGYAYWTMTPNSYNSTSANVRIISSSGTSSGAPVDSTNTLLRPVINLKAGVLNSGTGLWNDPYKII